MRIDQVRGPAEPASCKRCSLALVATSDNLDWREARIETRPVKDACA